MYQHICTFNQSQHPMLSANFSMIRWRLGLAIGDGFLISYAAPKFESEKLFQGIESSMPGSESFGVRTSFALKKKWMRRSRLQMSHNYKPMPEQR